MSDPNGAAFGALLTAAAHHQHVQEPAFEVVRLKLRTNAVPGAMDLTCNETLPPDPVPVVQPLAPAVVTVPSQLPPAPQPQPTFDALSVHNLYWSKHKVLNNMMDGFAHTLTAQLDKTGPKRTHSKAVQLSAILKEKLAPGTRPGKLKTIADHESLDEMIAVVCKMHTKIVNHAAHGRFRSQGGKGPIPLV